MEGNTTFFGIDGFHIFSSHWVNQVPISSLPIYLVIRCISWGLLEAMVNIYNTQINEMFSITMSLSIVLEHFFKLFFSLLKSGSKPLLEACWTSFNKKLPLQVGARLWSLTSSFTLGKSPFLLGPEFFFLKMEI